MPDEQTHHTTSLTGAVARYILRSRKKITILFTDIEDSTRYWEKHGDVQGRLMVDLHNRLTFPVIRRFHGKIIKTIGDSIMASFKKPENAVKAAMGMQQMLAQARKADPTFTLRIRIGVHTGLALVEAHDVFGDVVNTAARVESEAKGNEILVSSFTARAVSEFEFGLRQAGRFKPKGKSEKMSLYRCPWEDFESLVDGIKPGSYLPVVARQKIVIGVYVLVAAVTAYFFFLHYLRYLAADYKNIAVLTLNPGLILKAYPALIAVLVGVLLLGVVVLLRVRAAPHLTLRLLSGGFGFSIGFFVFLLPSFYLPFDLIPTSKNVLHASNHLFVEVKADDAAVHTQPEQTSRVLRRVDSGAILLQINWTERRGRRWNQVYLGPEESGWIIRKQPPAMGVPEKTVTEAAKFYFRQQDLYALILGLLGFAWGYWNFRIRPA